MICISSFLKSHFQKCHEKRLVSFATSLFCTIVNSRSFRNLELHRVVTKTHDTTMALGTIGCMQCPFNQEHGLILSFFLLPFSGSLSRT
jgi:hypothetical protein